MFMKKLLSGIFVLVLCLTILPVTALAEDEIRVRGVELNLSRVTIGVDETRHLTAYVTPYNASDKYINWDTSNSDVVEVDSDGVITGISPGSARITAYAANDKSAVCTVIVSRSQIRDPDLLVRSSDLPGSIFSYGEKVTAQALKADIESALYKTTGSGTVNVVQKEKASVTAEALRAAAYSAKAAKRKIMLQFTTYDSNARITQGQLNISAALAEYAVGDIRTGVYSDEDNVVSAREKFMRQFDTQVAVIRCGQKGSYGMVVEVIAKVDLGSMDTGNLDIHAYDVTSNTYTKLKDAPYWIDEKGYIHIGTDTGGYLLITENGKGFKGI